MKGQTWKRRCRIIPVTPLSIAITLLPVLCHCAAYNIYLAFGVISELFMKIVKWGRISRDLNVVARNRYPHCHRSTGDMWGIVCLGVIRAA